MYYILYRKKSLSLRHINKTLLFCEKSGVFDVYLCLFDCMFSHFVTKICY